MFDHQNESLRLEVKRNSQDVGSAATQDARNLSGGERSITTLAPIAQRVLGDAYALSRGGLCRRVAVLHSVKGYVANAVLTPLLKLSPVHPAKAFAGELADDALRWAGAHASSAKQARCEAE